VQRKELTTEQKMKAHEEGILNAPSSEFAELLIWYGAGPIYNLVRKSYIGQIMAAKGKKIIAYKGSEPLIAHAQQKIYARLTSNKNIGEEKVICYLLDMISHNKALMKDITKHILPFSHNGMKEEDVKEMIKNFLLTKKFEGAIPTSETVYRKSIGAPGENGFRYLEEVLWEPVDNTFIVHIPYFQSYEESMERIQQAETQLLKDTKKHNLPYCTILTHANPGPHLSMRRSGKTDHNKEHITNLCRNILAAKKYKTGDISLIAGHLHERRKRYTWDDAYPIQIYTLGVTDIARIDTKTNKIKINDYRLRVLNQF
jgi:hypothetical protein